MRIPGIFAAVALSFVPLVSRGAITYAYSSPFGEIGKLSNGDLLPTDGTFSFSLGGFMPGFTPTAANESDWQANFQMIGSSTNWFNDGGGTGEFGTTVVLSVNTSTLAVGAQAYIWGFNTTSITSSTEWLLFKNPAWLIGDASTSSPPIQFSTGDVGTTAVVGVLNNPEGLGANPYIQTALVVPEPSSGLLVSSGVVALVAWGRRSRRRAIQAR